MPSLNVPMNCLKCMQNHEQQADCGVECHCDQVEIFLSIFKAYAK